MNTGLFLLLLACHWAGDFTHLSRPYMLAAKRIGYPFGPILDHAVVHGALMFSVLFIAVSPIAAITALFIEVPTHFGIDVLKGKMNEWVPSLQSPANTFHWWVFGIDQYAHVAVIVLILTVI